MRLAGPPKAIVKVGLPAAFSNAINPLGLAVLTSLIAACDRVVELTPPPDGPSFDGSGLDGMAGDGIDGGVGDGPPDADGDGGVDDGGTPPD